MIYAELYTGNFTFRVFAEDYQEANDQMQKAWKKHAKEMGATYTWEDLEDAVNVFWFRQGDVYRDSQLLTSYDTPRERTKRNELTY